MSEPNFDPAQALQIDLSRGQLTLRSQTGPTATGPNAASRLLIPTEGLLDLLSTSSPDAIAALGAGIGTDMGRRVHERLGSAIERASVELYLEHLGGELALSGFGCLLVERWGHALVLCIEGQRDSEALSTLLGSMLEAAIQRSLSRDVVVIQLTKTEGTIRFLVAGRHAEGPVKDWLATGMSYGDVLTRLHQAPTDNHASKPDHRRGES
ncbi:MAG TPA: hypothetical protein VIV60_27670 [Polyangiaceae bacterium]